MTKLKKSNELLWIMSIIFVAFGVALCGKADLGVSMIAAPAFVVSEALTSAFGSFFSVGVTEYILQGILLALLCLVISRFSWRYLLSFAVAVVYGYILNFFIWLLSGIQVASVVVRWCMLIAGDCVIALGVACFFRTYMPLQVYELFVSELSRKFKLSIGRVKWCFDVSLLVISVVLAIGLFRDLNTMELSSLLTSSYHNIGLGTLITTAINSPLIMLMGKLIDRCFEPSARFQKLEAFLKID